MIAPRLQASALYYKTKLSCHNFTMYNLKSGEVVCYFWYEEQGDLSANSFATCVRDCLATVVENPNITRIILFSDGCGYQNRNVVLANALLDFSTTHKVEILQKYLEKGHTQMEVDSIHSVIERKLKNRSIYYPGDYTEIMRECRPAAPFKVKEVMCDFFKDFTGIKYVDSIRPGRRAGEPQVHNLRVLRYLPTPAIEYKTDFSDEFSPLPQRMHQRLNDWEIRQLHQQALCIKPTKYQHLQQLKAVIPHVYHAFYDDLRH